MVRLVLMAAGRMTLLPLAFLISLPVQSQPASQAVRGPVAGFVFDKTLGIRPIEGVPGAATLGRAVLVPTGLENVIVAPARDYALATLSAGGEAVVVRNLAAGVSAAVLNASPGASRIAISSSGDAAVLYYDRPARIEVLTRLPDTPSVSWASVLAGPSGNPAALAVSDEGGAVLLAASGDHAPIWLATSGGQRVLYTAAGSPSLAFLTGSTDALIADGAASSVLLARDPLRDMRIIPVGGPAEGLSHPVAVAAARDNRTVFAINAEPAGVVSLGLAGDAPRTIACSCIPAALGRMADGSIFRLTDPGDGPVWLLDLGSSLPRIVFVPDRLHEGVEIGRGPLPRPQRRR